MTMPEILPPERGANDFEAGYPIGQDGKRLWPIPKEYLIEPGGFDSPLPIVGDRVSIAHWLLGIASVFRRDEFSTELELPSFVDWEKRDTFYSSWDARAWLSAVARTERTLTAMAAIGEFPTYSVDGVEQHRLSEVAAYFQQRGLRLPHQLRRIGNVASNGGVESPLSTKSRNHLLGVIAALSRECGIDPNKRGTPRN